MTIGEAMCPSMASQQARPNQMMVDNIEPPATTDLQCDLPINRNRTRGRSLKQEPRCTNPLSRAESRNRDYLVELDGRPIRRIQDVSRSSTFFDDPTEPSAILDDILLEPYPHLPLCDSVSEVLIGDDSSRRSSAVVNRLRRAVTSSVDEIFVDEPRSEPIPALIAVFGDCSPLHPAPTRLEAGSVLEGTPEVRILLRGPLAS